MTKDRILELTDDAFRQLLQLLIESQGESLSRFSKAVEHIMDAMLDGSFEHGKPQAFEEIDEAKILQLPKGSQELLNLIVLVD